MRIVQYTGPTSEPIDLYAAKQHLRVDAPDDDDLITQLVTTARTRVEHWTRRALLTQTWDYSLNAWPNGQSVRLPFGTLQSVTHVKWLDTAAAETTLTLTTDYLVETNGEACGRLVLPYAETWPSGTLYPSNPITIRFVCGWTAAALVPSPIRAAIKMVLADLYENREAQINTGAMQPYNANATVDALLAGYRLWDEFL